MTALMHLLGRLRGKSRQRAATLLDAVQDTASYVLFLAALGATYTGVDEAIALLGGKTR